MTSLPALPVRPYLYAHETGNNILVPRLTPSNSASSLFGASASTSMCALSPVSPVPPVSETGTGTTHTRSFVSMNDYIQCSNMSMLRLKEVAFPAVRKYNRTTKQLVMQKVGGENVSTLVRASVTSSIAGRNHHRPRFATSSGAGTGTGTKESILWAERLLEKVLKAQEELFDAGYVYYNPSPDDFKWYENKLWMVRVHNVFQYVSAAYMATCNEEWKRKRYDSVKREIEHRRTCVCASPGEPAAAQVFPPLA